MDILYKNETYNIIGAAQEVHRTLGHGFLEPIYQEALAIELTNRNILYQKEKELDITYKDQILTKRYIADFICHDAIILEIKALNRLTKEHEAQLLNYLNATKHKLGLLINFGQPSLAVKRIIL